MHTYSHTYTHIHTYSHIYTYITSYSHIYTHIRTYSHIYTHIHKYSYIYTQIYTYTNICTHIQTYAHISKQLTHTCIHRDRNLYITTYITRFYPGPLCNQDKSMKTEILQTYTYTNICKHIHTYTHIHTNP